MATTTPNDDALTATDRGRIEYLLKKEMAKQLMSIQTGRANNTRGHNVGTTKKYVQNARTLRKVLTQQHRKGYEDLREIFADLSYVDDDEQARMGLERTDSVADALDKIHEHGYIPPEDRRVLADHDSVPGHSPERGD